MLTLPTKHKVMIAKTTYHLVNCGRKILGKSDHLRIRRSGLMWELDLAEGIDFSIFLLGAFEPRTINLYKQLIKNGDVVLDIGANIGAHTLPLAKLVGPQGKVIAFEPTAFAFQKLKRNLSLNPELQKQVDAEQAIVVASDDGVVENEIYSSWPLKDTGDVHEKHRGKLKSTAGATALTLDKAVASRGLIKLDFIKLDVDGHEFQVLSGGINVFKTFRPTLLMELEPCLYVSKPEEFDGIITLLKNLGGNVTDVNTGATLPLDTKALRDIIPDGASRNILVRF